MRCPLLAAAVLLALNPAALSASTVDTAAAHSAAQNYLASAPFSTRSAATPTTTGDRAALASSVLAANYVSTIASP